MGASSFYYPLESRIEAHIFNAFLAYCLPVTLTQQLRPHASGLTARSVREKFAPGRCWMYTSRPPVVANWC